MKVLEDKSQSWTDKTKFKSLIKNYEKNWKFVFDFESLGVDID